MKKAKKALLTAAIFSAALNLTGCDNGFQCVYGPPPDEDVTTAPVTTAETTTAEEKTAPEESSQDSETNADTTTSPPVPPTTYIPETEMPECVYGPPPSPLNWFFGLF